MKPIPRLTKQEKETIYSLLKSDDYDNYLIAKISIEQYLPYYSSEKKFRSKILQLLKERPTILVPKAQNDIGWSKYIVKFINLK